MEATKPYNDKLTLRYLGSLYYLPYKDHTLKSRTLIEEYNFIKRNDLLGKLGILTLDSLAGSIDKVPYSEGRIGDSIENVVKNNEKNVFYALTNDLDFKTRRQIENNLASRKQLLNFFQRFNYSSEIKVQRLLSKIFGYKIRGM